MSIYSLVCVTGQVPRASHMALPLTAWAIVDHIIYIFKSYCYTQYGYCSKCILCTHSLDIGTMRKQYTWAYCTSNMNIRIECAVWLAYRGPLSERISDVISCQRQDANVLPKRRQSHQGDKLCDVSMVPLVARWPVFLARGSDADGKPHCSNMNMLYGCRHPSTFLFK